MENTITLNSGQKIEVLLQDEVSLDIDCALRYIKSGEQEINAYVRNTAQPQLNAVIKQAETDMAVQIAEGIENAAKTATDAARREISSVREKIDVYTQQHILPELNGVLAGAENAAALASAQAAAAAEIAGEFDAHVQEKQNIFDADVLEKQALVNAKTDAAEAAAARASESADLAESWVGQAAEITSGLLDGKADTDFNNISQTGKNAAINWIMPDYSAGISVTDGFEAPCAGLYRHYGINVSGETYVNGLQVDSFSWHPGSWAGHAGCSLILNAGDKITGTIPNGKFYPMKGIN